MSLENVGWKSISYNYYYKVLGSVILCLQISWLKVVGLVVMGSLQRVWEVDVPGLKPTMESTWEITLCSQLILTNVLDGVGCLAMTHPHQIQLYSFYKQHIPSRWPVWSSTKPNRSISLFYNFSSTVHESWPSEFYRSCYGENDTVPALCRQDPKLSN